MGDSTSSGDDFVEASSKVYEKGYEVHKNIIGTIERPFPEVPEPARHLLKTEEFWASPDVPSAENIKEHLKNEGILLFSSIVL
jgi:hypothetical protein